MTLFESFRNGYGFTSYNDNRTAVTYDIPLAIVTYLCVLVSIATLIATLGIRGTERWSFTVRACYAVAVGSIILACLFGHGWMAGSLEIKSHYVYRNNLPFKGVVGIKVALDGANVTLDGYYSGLSGRGYVYYSENIPWADFGDQENEFMYFLQRGLPEPILKIMGYMTIDEGNLRWGHSLHTSGYFAMVLLWTSLAFWIVSNVLLCSVIIYGAYTFILTGLCMILACVTYHVCQCSVPLAIRFGDDTLIIRYDWSYWLALVTGCLTTMIGLLLVAADHFAHEGVSGFFHLEKLTEVETFEFEDRGENYSTVLKDRRGHLTSTSSDRYGSIFLESCRQPGVYRTSQKNRFFLIKPKNTNLDNSTTNPLYSGTDQVNCPDHVRNVAMLESVCEEDEVFDNRISLSTFPEHADKKKIASMCKSETAENPEESGRKQSKRVRHQHDVFSIDIGHTDYSTSSPMGERKFGCDALETERKGCLKNASSTFPRKDTDARDTREILVTVEPFCHQPSRDRSEELLEADQDTSGEGCDCERCEETRVQDLQSLESDSSESSGVIVNMNCS